MQLIQEHSSKIKATLPKRDPTKKQEVFYNPIMKSNRNISIVLLNSISNKEMNIALPLAGSGIRGLRFLQELKKNKIQNIFINDKKENFINAFENNLKLNKSKQIKEIKDKIKVFNEDVIRFLLTQHCEDFCGYFDYIDIDPFGSPNPFLGAAVFRIKRKGILAITATDTAALTGTYPKVTKRKYWATSLRNYMMHETGLRILIRKVQLQGVQFEKALTPILSYHKDHYFRVYFRSKKSKERCDKIIRQHQYLLFCLKCLNFKVSGCNCGTCECKSEFHSAGPLWTGRLFDAKVLKKMIKGNEFEEEKKFLSLLFEESKKDIPGFYNLHVIAKKYKLILPKMETALKKLKAVRTHFFLNGIKTEKNIREILKIIKK